MFKVKVANIVLNACNRHRECVEVIYSAENISGESVPQHYMNKIKVNVVFLQMKTKCSGYLELVN